MNNYVMIYRLSDGDTEQFKHDLEETFNENLQEESENIRYFGFTAREQPEVEDKVGNIIHRYGLSEDDYVALYYTRPEQPDQIMRHMIVGHDTYLSDHMEEEKAGKEEHTDRLSRLLNYDFIKARTRTGAKAGN
ncbi:hypothetical protein AB9P05_05615 [Roseivirga sp. BDSF3-8]|uniref:hypothetical protein n=1 Tax=Roseivirga sp. BDSF3-8 TaxID=3241598 RepID=UPI003532674A